MIRAIIGLILWLVGAVLFVGAIVSAIHTPWTTPLCEWHQFFIDALVLEGAVLSLWGMASDTWEEFISQAKKYW